MFGGDKQRFLEWIVFQSNGGKKISFGVRNEINHKIGFDGF